VMSVAPPGAYGMIMRTGRTGNFSAAPAETAAAAQSAASNVQAIFPILMVSSSGVE